MVKEVEFILHSIKKWLLIGAIIVPLQMFSQNAWQNSQIWMDFNFSTPLNSKIKLGGTAGLKSNIDFLDWHVWHIRPRVYFVPNERFDFHVGLGIFENLYTNKASYTETRLEQQIALNGPKFQKFKIDHRLRLEQWHVSYNNNRENEKLKAWKGKIRYRIRAKTKEFDLFNIVKAFHFLIGAETYVPITRMRMVELAEQQIFIGFSQLVAKEQQYEVNFLWQGKIHPNRTEGSNRSNFLGLRLRYFWTRG